MPLYLTPFICHFFSPSPSLPFLCVTASLFPLSSKLNISVSPNVHVVLLLYLLTLYHAQVSVTDSPTIICPNLSCVHTTGSSHCSFLFLYLSFSPPTLHLSCLAGEKTGGAANFRPQERPIILLKHWGQREGGKEGRGEVRRGKGGGTLQVSTALTPLTY